MKPRLKTGLVLNADLGEIEDSSQKIERALMPLINMANISCGGHAGSETSIDNSLALAKQFKVLVGAHPGYEDRENFGRLSHSLSQQALAKLLHTQLDYLQDRAALQNITVAYIKPHGALYNDMMANNQLRQQVFAVVAERAQQAGQSAQLMLLATRQWQQHQQEAKAVGIRILFEAFADRRYNHQGLLMPRSEKGAVLSTAEALEQARQLHQHHSVTTANKQILAIKAHSLCIHGDSNGAIELAQKIRHIIDA